MQLFWAAPGNYVPAYLEHWAVDSTAGKHFPSPVGHNPVVPPAAEVDHHLRTLQVPLAHLVLLE